MHTSTHTHTHTHAERERMNISKVIQKKEIALMRFHVSPSQQQKN